MANNEVRIIITGDNQAGPALRRALDQMDRVERQGRRTNTSLRDSFRQGVRGGPQLLETAALNAGSAVGALVNPLTLAAGGALLLGQQLSVSTKEAREFEKVFTNVASLSAHAADDLESLRKSVLRLAPKVGQGPDALAEALYDVVSAGYAGDEAMDVLEASAKGAAAGLTDTKVAADVVTTALNAYGLGAENAVRITDLIQTAVKEGKTTWAEMGSSLGQVIPLAASTGVEFGVLNAVIATTTSQGIKTAESITGVKAILSAVLKPSSEAAELAGELGLAFDAQALKAKGLAGFLDDVVEATGGNVEPLTKLFGSVEALNTILALTSESGGKKFLQAQEAMQDASGATERAFETQAQTAEFMAARRDAAIESIRISVGTIFLPAITEMTEGIASVLDKIVEWQNRLPPLERNMKSFKEQNEGATEAVELLQGAIGEKSGNGLLGAIDSLAGTLNNEGRTALEKFALNTVGPLIAQGKLQEAIDLTIAKFIALQTEENASLVASNQRMLDTAYAVKDQIKEELDFLIKRSKGKLTASPLIQESIDDKLIELQDAEGEVTKYREALEEAQAPMRELTELQDKFTSGALSAEEATQGLLDALGYGQNAVDNASRNNSNESSNDKNSPPPGGGAGNGGGGGVGTTVAQEKSYVQTQVDLISAELARLAAVRDAGLINAEQYEAEVAGHYRRLEGLWTDHQGNMTSAEQTALLNLKTSIAPERYIPEARVPGTAPSTREVAPNLSVDIYNPRQAQRAAQNDDLNRQQQVLNEQAWADAADAAAAAAEKEARALEAANEARDRTVSSLAAATAQSGDYVSVKDRALGAVVRLTEAQASLGQASRADVAAALQEQLAAIERVLPALDTGSDLYYQLAGAAERAQGKLDGLSLNVDLSGKNGASANTEALEALINATDDYLELIGEAPSEIEAFVDTLEQLKETYPELADELDKLIDKTEDYERAQKNAARLTNTIDQVAQVATQVSELTGLSEELGFNVENVIANGAQLATSIATGDIFGAVKAGIGLIAELGQSISDLFTGDSGAARNMREGFYKSMYGGLAQGAQAFINGEGGMLEYLEKALNSAVLNAVVGALIQSAVLEGAIGEYVKKMSKAFARGDYDAARGYAQQIKDEFKDLAPELEEILEPFKDFGVKPDIKKPDPADLENTINSTVDFGGVPPAVQFAVATPLVEAAELMYQAAELMLQGQQVKVTAASPLNALSAEGDLGRFSRTIERAEAMYGRVESMYSRLLDEGVLIRSEQTVKVNTPKQASSTAHLR